ncbi:MAG: di-trans,poly-cis-decaprenylcistransferase [Alteromonadaceae bacterium]|nr:di-trans,poly-cis-decaprenylcistransferase [Alteromonadaceae bacterium]|tara:strand:+ start:3010 stop:3804 length:795 start_codon:yes stop_codon:yes gene_type:complete
MSEQISTTIPVEAPAMPRHVAIIMDGNNRWAKLKRLRGIAGHKAGVDAVRAVVETCAREAVEVLTLFAFSSENWRRPEEEVGALMKLFLIALKREVRKLHRNNIRLRIIGEKSRFSKVLQEHMAAAEELTAANSGMTLVIAANYGGQWDLTQAARSLAMDVAEGSLSPDAIDEAALQSRLALGDLPHPDLMIRTAGEKRISNFMLWHLAYTEFYFSPVYWPDFKHEEMQKALEDYSLRKRRFGRTDDQVDAVASETPLLRQANR